jgi:hypothetical protein
MKKSEKIKRIQKIISKDEKLTIEDFNELYNLSQCRFKNISNVNIIKSNSVFGYINYSYSLDNNVMNRNINIKKDDETWQYESYTFGHNNIEYVGKFSDLKFFNYLVDNKFIEDDIEVRTELEYKNKLELKLLDIKKSYRFRYRS